MLKNLELDKSIVRVKLRVPAGSATTAPPIGTILGQYRVDIMGFCKQYNEITSNLDKNVLLPVKISLKVGGSFLFQVKTPATTYLIKRLLVELKSLDKKKLSPLSLYKITKIKQKDLNLKEKAIFKSIKGTLKSMQLSKYHL